MSTTTGIEADLDTDSRDDAVCDAVARVREGLVSGTGWTGIDLDSLPSDDLLASHRELARMRRQLDAMVASSSAAIARRSMGEDGQQGMAKRQGYRTPEELLASISGGSTGEARGLIEVGDMLASDEREAHAGEGSGDLQEAGVVEVSPRFAIASERVRAGKLHTDAGRLIKRMLTRIWDRREDLGVELCDIERVERMLVERAHGLSSNKFARIVRQLEAQMDAGRHALTEELQRHERSVTMYEDHEGMFVLRARLDAETAAPVRAALDSLVGNALHNRRDNDGVATDDGQVMADDRSVPQIRADALAALARHCLGCRSEDLPFASTTVVVRLSLADLQDGTGVAEIDGGSEPVCIPTARRMAANGAVIPVVLGGKGEILDLGRGSRPFSYAQRIALIERDGGCAFCGAPPAYTEAHHIKWWARDRGKTDLENGVLLCSICHHRIHRDDWEIGVRDNQVWFRPPAAVDPERKPRLGGRARFGLPKIEAA
ncbi:HNH endonuclease signature motif containing protein [Demequina oxidasica]|uniref:HNH endonuclease signature motif containing protein n=1 Tax=Demequina oxidasica TaxID=676199 RepID=UPI00078237F0|nr:HNH endonuclease signature motif containing protein [Demequina oxidasica]